MTKEERAIKWLEKMPGADKLSMEERVHICNRAARETAIVFFAILAGELAVMYIAGGGTAFAWLADRMNRFAAGLHGTRRYKILAWFGVIFYLPFLLLPVAAAMIYKNKRLAVLLKQAYSDSEKTAGETDQANIQPERGDAGKHAESKRAEMENAAADIGTVWMNRWDQIKRSLDCKIDLESYFHRQRMGEADLDVLDLGMVHFATGKVIACDPFVELGEAVPYMQTIPAGIYSVKIAVSNSEYGGIRYACAKVEVSDKKPIRYELAMTGKEKLDQEFEEEGFFGFDVDAGMACIADAATQDAFNDFWKKLWDRNHSINPFDDVFSDLLEESYKKYPKYQSEMGDWLNWRIPGTDCDLPIFSSGWGDGSYPVYFGYDAAGEVTGIYAHFIDVEDELSSDDVGVNEDEDNLTEKTYTDWSMETDSAEQAGLTMKDVNRQLEAIRQGVTEFVIFTPAEPIKVKETGETCGFVQICQDEDQEYFHLEVSIANAAKSSGSVIYGKDRQSGKEVQKLLGGLLDSRIVPDCRDWDIVLDMRKEEENISPEEAVQSEENACSYKKIAELMTDDMEVRERLSACFLSPGKYYNEHAEQYEDRGFEGDEPEDKISWIGLANEMIACGTAVELDWKTDKEEFSGQMKGLADRHQLALREDWLKADGDIPVWCAALDEKWAEADFCAAAMDIDSDSYVIFICKREVLKKLQALGKKIHHRFDFAKNM